MKSLFNILRTFLLIFMFHSCEKNDDKITDLDGNVYTSITSGTQVWMVENLKTTKYNDGTSIPNVTDGPEWSTLITPAYCWNNEAATYKPTYGALYNWYAANSGKLCPTGWHVPTEAEWSTLTTYLGGLSVAGGKLKAKGTIEGGDGLWYSPNSGATNESGFTSLPAGDRNCTDGKFSSMGYSNKCWSSTESIFNIDAGIGLFTFNEFSYAEIGNIAKPVGISVRCLKDE
jgi:uncharacterized protein (TIGR02145 family)